MELVDIVSALGIPTILGVTIPFLVTRFYNKKDKKEENNNEIEEQIKDLSNFKDDVEKDLESIKSILIILKKSEQAILRDRIIQAYNHYFKEKKFMPIYARESLDHMYKEYHNLDGNGIIEDLIEKLYKLPTEPNSDYEENDV